MSYEDLEEARAKCVAEQTVNNKRWYGQERKDVAIEKDDFEPDLEPEADKRSDVSRPG